MLHNLRAFQCQIQVRQLLLRQMNRSPISHVLETQQGSQGCLNAHTTGAWQGLGAEGDQAEG